VQVGKVEGGQQLTEGSVTDPAEEGKGPPEAREEAQFKHTDIVTPVGGEAESNLPSVLVSTYLAGHFSPVFLTGSSHHHEFWH
jgi:hypothetical protein